MIRAWTAPEAYSSAVPSAAPLLIPTKAEHKATTEIVRTMMARINYVESKEDRLSDVGLSSGWTKL